MKYYRDQYDEKRSDIRVRMGNDYLRQLRMYDRVSTSSAEESKLKVKKKLFESLVFCEMYLICSIFE